MADNYKNHGICSTCNNIAHCSHFKNSNHPIWYCEFFDDYVSPQETTLEVAIQSHKKLNTNTNIKKKKEVCFKGLCINCDHRETCTYPKPEESVWHCSEYQ